MRKLETFEFVSYAPKTAVEYPEEVWSGDIIELTAEELNVRNADDLSSRRQSLRKQAEVRGLDCRVNRGRDENGKPSMTLVVQCVPKVMELPAEENIAEEATSEAEVVELPTKGRARKRA